MGLVKTIHIKPGPCLMKLPKASVEPGVAQINYTTEEGLISLTKI